MLTLSKFDGKTEAEAIEKCTTSLDKEIDELYIKKSEIETKLFKQKKYIVEAIPKQSIMKYIKYYLKEIDKSFNINIKADIKESDDIIKVTLISNNNSILIGTDGKNIEALQTLIRNSIRNQTGLNIKVEIDVSNYKKNKEEKFIKEINELIKEVEETHIDIKLDPMNSYKRRIVHNLVKNYVNLKTESTGTEPVRYTIIKYKED